jgi:hypothetical protein
MDEQPLIIRGGAGAYEAAAIAVAVQYVLEAEAAARATPPGRSVPPAWVRRAQPRSFGRFEPPVTHDP